MLYDSEHLLFSVIICILETNVIAFSQRKTDYKELYYIWFRLWLPKGGQGFTRAQNIERSPYKGGCRCIICIYMLRILNIESN